MNPEDLIEPSDDFVEDRIEGHFKNGDLWYGEWYTEEGHKYYIAVNEENGPYETLEIPERYPLFTMIRFDDGTPEAVVDKYLNHLHERITP